MNLVRWSGGMLFVFAASLFLTGTGCNKKERESGKDPPAVAKKDPKKDDHPNTKYAVHKGWWCEPHGVPEEECSLCLPDEDVDKQFKSKGDWCKLHDRAKSQCFKCDPKLYEEFAARYKAKFGEDPPRPPAGEFK